ncbi:MAG: DUF748 domain-containing protein [Candidatus Omnitrophica bacterium]|nr:DUF748 domain-containing protein [Candidatus Omnitrophota bacterium]
MTKKLIHVLIALLLIVAGAISYLGSVTLPIKIHTIVTEEIERATGKRVFIDSVHFNILKGLILDRVIIYDSHSILIWAKSISCGVPFSAISGQKFAIPSVTVESPAVYLERRADNSFNLGELLPGSGAHAAALALHRMAVRNARVIFIDRTVEPAFIERIDDLDMKVKFSQPDTAALELTCEIPLSVPARLKFSGVYLVSRGKLAGRGEAERLSLKEFRDYYKEAGIDFPSGTVDVSADLRADEKCLEIELDGRLKSFCADMDGFKVKMESGIKAMASYDFKEKALEYAGKLDVRSMDLDGLEAIGKLENLKAHIEFTDSRMWSEDIIVDAYGIRWDSKVNIVNFARPIVDIYASAGSHLGAVQKMLKDEFGITLPTEISGKADIALAMHSEPEKPFKMNGYLAFRGATMSLGSGNFPLEALNGEAQFDLNGARWSKVALKYREVPYTASGRLSDFSAPKIELDVASKDLSFASTFSPKEKQITLSSLEGRYFNSTFSITGAIDLVEQNAIDGDIKGELKLRMSDLRKMVKSSAGLQKMKPEGTITATFGLKGQINALKTCDAKMKIKSDHLSIHGITMTDMIMDYSQQDGMGQIKSLKADFYGGSLFATGKIDWTARAMPYAVSFDALDVKLEDLKADTDFRDREVSGRMKILAQLSGTIRDASRFSGTGRISIADGKLWQLNLFQGIGTLIYSSDFSDIVFTQGSLDMEIGGREIKVKNFMLKSDLLDLYGAGVIGYDRSISAIVRPEVKEDAIGGTKERIAKAVSGNTAIKITGTLENPEYKAQANFADVVGGIAGAIFNQ